MLNMSYYVIPTQYLPPNTEYEPFPKIGLRVWAATFERYTPFLELVICSLVFAEPYYQTVRIDRGIISVFG